MFGSVILKPVFSSLYNYVLNKNFQDLKAYDSFKNIINSIPIRHTSYTNK